VSGEPVSDVDLLVTGIGQLVTPAGACGDGALRGARHGALDVTRDAALAVHDGRVAWAGPADAWRGEARATLDAGGAAVVPGLVDPHTHLVWAGDRLADFEARAAGAGYEAILAAGGGIRHTMRCTAAALARRARRRGAPPPRRPRASGATTVEVKSGYGFTAEAELRMLHAVAALRAVGAGVRRGRDAPPPRAAPDAAERAAYVAARLRRAHPRGGARRLAEAVDVFVEREAFSVDEAAALLTAARAHGLATKLHADQFHAIGGTELAVAPRRAQRRPLRGVGPRADRRAGARATVATLLPGVSLHLGLPAAPGRALIDAGAAVAVGTDLNPGSSPVFSAALPMALAVRLNRLTPAEALVAATANAAAALGRRDRGRLAVGCRADLLVLDADDWRELPYALGRPVVRACSSPATRWRHERRRARTGGRRHAAHRRRRRAAHPRGRGGRGARPRARRARARRGGAHAGEPCLRRAARRRGARGVRHHHRASASCARCTCRPARCARCSATSSSRTPWAWARRSPPRWCAPCCCCAPVARPRRERRARGDGAAAPRLPRARRAPGGPGAGERRGERRPRAAGARRPHAHRRGRGGARRAHDAGRRRAARRRPRARWSSTPRRGSASSTARRR
jgi:imidazolonepropionase